MGAKSILKTALISFAAVAGFNQLVRGTNLFTNIGG